MKLEMDHVLGVQSPPRKSYNPFDSDDEIEATNGYVKNNLNGYDIKSFETNADSLTFHLDNSDVSWEEAILSHSQILRNSITGNSNGDEVLSRKDTELFTDKTVTECDLPELMVNFKENVYHSVKDIGIDEGIRSRNTNGSENKPSLLNLDGGIMEGLKSRSENNLENDISYGKWPQDTMKDRGHDHETVEKQHMEGLKSRSENNMENDISYGKWPQDTMKDSGHDHETVEMQHMEGLKSRSENNLENNISSGTWAQDIMKNSGQDHETSEKQLIADQCGADDSTNLDEIKLSSSKQQSNFSLESKVDQFDIGREAVSSRDPQTDETGDLSSKKMESKEEVDCEEHRDGTLHSEKTRESSTMMSITDSAEVSTESSESVYEEATSSLSPEIPASQESPESGITNVLSYNSKVEIGSIILDFNSSTAKHKEEEEISPHIETVAKPPEAQLMSRIDEGRILDSDTENRVHGETSFSAAAPPSSITYLGPFSHAGNISLRSESSAGSTRSFAFPVLQAEYNSSPVRMAKAEHRNRKLRGWIHSVMCCRF